VDEITLLRAVRPEVPDFSEYDRGEVLCRLLAAATGERSRGHTPARASRARQVPARRPPLAWWLWQRWATPRLARGAGVVVALAIAAAGVAALVLPTTGEGTTADGHGATAPGTGTPGGPGSPQPGNGYATGPMPEPTSLPAHQGAPASAAALLHLAAQAAAATPELTPSADDFVYTDVLTVGQQYSVGNDPRPQTAPPFEDRAWMSADGQRGLSSEHLALPGGTWSSLSAPESLCGGAEGDPTRQICDPAYLGDLPGTAPGMLSHLLSSGGPNGPALYKILLGVMNTSWLAGQLVPNRSYALIYEALATVSGLQLVPHVTDAAGRPGIAVAGCVPSDIDKGSMPGFKGCPERYVLIFDARTFELVGIDDVNPRGAPVMDGDSALLGIDVVSKPGQLP
jgi:hypothetical protein